MNGKALRIIKIQFSCSCATKFFQVLLTWLRKQMGLFPGTCIYDPTHHSDLYRYQFSEYDAIIHPCSNLNDGIATPSLKLRHRSVNTQQLQLRIHALHAMLIISSLLKGQKWYLRILLIYLNTHQQCAPYVLTKTMWLYIVICIWINMQAYGICT